VEGHRAAINMTGLSGGTASLSLYEPFGTVAGSKLNAAVSGFLDTVLLRYGATYSVVFDPQSTNATSGTLTLYDVPADVATPIPFATATGVTISGPGQNGRLPFTGTSGHRLSVAQTGFNCFTSTTSILGPSGEVIATGCGGNFLDATSALAASGAYTVLIDPKDANVGTTTVTLYDVPADLTGTLSIGAAPTAVPLQTPGQNAQVTFAGTNGQLVTVHVTSNTITGTLPCVTVSLLRQAGSTMTQNSSCGGSFNLAQQTLPASETYMVKIDPVGNSAGSLNVAVTTP
jgi:hypothetical protein